MKYKLRWIFFLICICTPSFLMAATATVVLKVNGVKGPISVPYGKSVTLSWASTETSSCSASEEQASATGWGGTLTLNGSKVINLIDSNTFIITCAPKSGATVTDKVSVYVIPVVDGPTVTITADDGQEESITVPYEGTTTLSWTSTDTIFCSDLVAGTSTDPGKVISGRTDGSKKISNLKNSQTFAITCEGLKGKLITANFDVEVTPLSLPVVDLTIDDQEGSTTIPSGASTTLSWTSTDTSTSSCNLSSVDMSQATSSRREQIVSLDPSGRLGVGPLFLSRLFNLSCKNAVGVATSSVTVFVSPPEDTSSNDAKPQEDSTSCVDLTRNMGYGSLDGATKNEVSALQSFLGKYGVYKNIPSGFLGKGTTIALVHFQKKEGILQTGFAGPLTRAKIKQLSCLRKNIN